MKKQKKTFLCTSLSMLLKTHSESQIPLVASHFVIFRQNRSHIKLPHVTGQFDMTLILKNNIIRMVINYLMQSHCILHLSSYNIVIISLLKMSIVSELCTQKNTQFCIKLPRFTVGRVDRGKAHPLTFDSLQRIN